MNCTKKLLFSLIFITSLTSNAIDHKKPFFSRTQLEEIRTLGFKACIDQGILCGACIPFIVWINKKIQALNSLPDSEKSKKEFSTQIKRYRRIKIVLQILAGYFGISAFLSGSYTYALAYDRLGHLLVNELTEEEAEEIRREYARQQRAKFEDTWRQDDTKSPYVILGVSSNASKQEIKRAYHQLTRQHHPDKNNGRNSERIKEIINAYEFLTKN